VTGSPPTPGTAPSNTGGGSGPGSGSWLGLGFSCGGGGSSGGGSCTNVRLGDGGTACVEVEDGGSSSGGSGSGTTEADQPPSHGLLAEKAFLLFGLAAFTTRRRRPSR
jgi:loricrin